MKDHSPHLRIIGQLAQEYDQKYRELEKLISEIPQQNILPQIEGACRAHYRPFSFRSDGLDFNTRII